VHAVGPSKKKRTEEEEVKLEKTSLWYFLNRRCRGVNWVMSYVSGLDCKPTSSADSAGVRVGEERRVWIRWLRAKDLWRCWEGGVQKRV